MDTLTLLWLSALSFSFVCNLGLTFLLIRRVNNTAHTVTSSNPASLDVGAIAPDFKAETLRGDTISLKSYAGRSFALIFFRPSCEPCREELPSYEAIAPNARQAGIELVLVSIAAPEETHAFFDSTPVRLSVLVAPRASNTLSHDYQIAGTPTFCLVDADGHVLQSGYTSDAFGEWRQLTRAWRAYRSPPLHTSISERG